MSEWQLPNKQSIHPAHRVMLETERQELAAFCISEVMTASTLLSFDEK